MKKITKRGDFDAETGDGGHVALFYSEYCPFCLTFLPVFEKLEKSASGRFLKVCTDDLPELEDLFAIEVVPTVIIFVDGKPAARLDGALGRGLGEKELLEFLKDRGRT